LHIKLSQILVLRVWIGQAEINGFDASILGVSLKHEVARLDVAMQNAMSMALSQSLEHSTHVRCSLQHDASVEWKLMS
jgi:hypothetical protein